MNAARVVAGIAAILFGALTVFEGGSVVFGGPEVWQAAGNVVPWVLYFNFSAGFLYMAIGLGTLLKHPHAAKMAFGLAVANVVVLIALGLYAATGGLFEVRTVVAMGVRTVFWGVQASVLARVLGRAELGNELTKQS